MKEKIADATIHLRIMVRCGLTPKSKEFQSMMRTFHSAYPKTVRDKAKASMRSRMSTFLSQV